MLLTKVFAYLFVGIAIGIITLEYFEGNMNPWYSVTHSLSLSIAFTLAIIVGIKDEKNQRKPGKWFYWVAGLAPVYFFISTIVQIIKL